MEETKRKIILSKTNQSDPKVVAERLVRRVIGDENYTDLAALGHFTIILPSENEYTLYRKRKTEAKLVRKYHLNRGRVDGRLFWDAGTYSCCIHPEDTSCPDADRIVAEYVLLCNDEQKYLFTANLTAISAPNAAIPMTGRQFEALRNGIWRDYNEILNNQTDALRYGFPPRLMTNPPEPNPEPAILPLPQPPQDPLIHHLANAICHLVFTHDRLRGLRFMNVRHGQVRYPQIYNVDFRIDEMLLRRRDGTREEYLNYISNAIIPPVVGELVEIITYTRPVGIFQLPPNPVGVDQVAMAGHHDGGSIRLVRAYDITRDQMIYQASIGLALPEDPDNDPRPYPRPGRNWF